MKKAVRKSIDVAYKLLPSALHNALSYQTFHFATLCKRNKIVSIGQNRVDKPSSKALYFAQRFGTKDKIEYPFLHAEIDCISRIWSKIYIDSSYTLVSIRLNKDGEFRMAKPCDDCQEVINSLGIKNVYWTTDKGVSKK